MISKSFSLSAATPASQGAARHDAAGRPRRFAAAVAASLTFFATLFASHAAAQTADESTPRLNVVATTSYVYDVVLAVVGEAPIDVTLLLGPGTDPHLYKPSARDVALLRSADAIFYSGLLLEGKLDNVLQRMSAVGKLVRPVSLEMPAEQLLEPAEFQGHYDPHVWNSPELWSTTPGVVAEALAALRPNLADSFRANGEAFRATIEETAAWCRAKAEELPAEKRVLVTSHDAFNYLGRAFGFKVLAPQGISTVSEAGIADIVETVRYIREHQVKAIFVESSVSPKVIQRISEESGAQVGGELFSDAMGSRGEQRIVAGESFDVGTYAGLMRYNVSTIVEALK